MHEPSQTPPLPCSSVLPLWYCVRRYVVEYGQIATQQAPLSPGEWFFLLLQIPTSFVSML